IGKALRPYRLPFCSDHDRHSAWLAWLGGSAGIGWLATIEAWMVLTLLQITWPSRVASAALNAWSCQLQLPSWLGGVVPKSAMCVWITLVMPVRVLSGIHWLFVPICLSRPTYPGGWPWYELGLVPAEEIA